MIVEGSVYGVWYRGRKSLATNWDQWVWIRQTVFFNCRASVLLECMSSPDRECRSVLYGVMIVNQL